MSNKVPQIRFNGYSDTWIENQLSSLIKIARQQEIKKEKLSSKPEGYYVLAMRTFSKDGYIDFSKPYWIKSDIEDKNAFLLPGEFAIIDADMDTSLPKIGKVLLNSYNKKFLLAAHVRKINVQSNVNSYFMYGVMRNEQLLRRLKKESSGSIAQGLLDKNIYKQTVYIPKILEQEKIGLFFKEFENIITLHQRKLDFLKEQKKGFLQKMFPKNGDKVPELRFEGFADDWEERKLGDYVIIRSGWSPSNFDINNNANNLFIKVDDLNYSTRVQKESQVKVNILSKYKKMKKSSTIFPKRGAAIMTNKVRMLGEDSYMDTNMMALEPKGIDPEYLYTFINKTGLYKIADTSTIPQINNKHIEPYLLLIPSLEEQHKIGSFFKQLDETIALHQRKLDLLKEQKKGFLQKMFL